MPGASALRGGGPVLGEYSALYAAGVLDRETVLKTLAFRGRAMEQAAEGLACGMTAVLSLERDKLQAACDQASELGVVQICNYNCPGQLVISGEKAAVDRPENSPRNWVPSAVCPCGVSRPSTPG